MLTDDLNSIRRKVRESGPLIHCITNPISINQCANAVLAVGASPMMAEHPGEVGEITASADALLLNFGNVTDVRMESMDISAKVAQKAGIPFVLDAVGVACSELRRRYARNLIQNRHPTVIKGNYSELYALYMDSYRSRGVDSDRSLSPEDVIPICTGLAKRHQAIILASGKTDIVTDGEKTAFIDNGVPQLSRVTGTGCVLGALCAAYLSARPDMTAAVTACAVLGISGELAETEKGNGTFQRDLLDNLSTLSEENLTTHLKIEVR